MAAILGRQAVGESGEVVALDYVNADASIQYQISIEYKLHMTCILSLITTPFLASCSPWCPPIKITHIRNKKKII